MPSNYATPSNLTSDHEHPFREISSTASKTTTTFASPTPRRDESAHAPDSAATAAKSTYQVQAAAVHHSEPAAGEYSSNTDSKSHHLAETGKEAGPSSLSIFPPSASTANTTSPSSSSHLPRTSSLLPPTTIVSSATHTNPQPEVDLVDTSPSFQDPFNDRSTIDLFQALNNIEPVTPSKGATSRSSSVGGLSDSFRNLNRWSNSTTSSRASPSSGHRRNKSSTSRRGSLGLLGLIHGSPKKHKQRPSLTIDHSPSQLAASSVSPGSGFAVPPFRTLPHIATLPSLDIELPDIVTATYQPPALLTTNQTQRPAPSERTNDEISAEYWDGPTASATPDDTSFWSAQVGDRTTVRIPEYYTVGSAKLSTATMPYQHGETRGHSRNRSMGAKGSGDSTSSATIPRERPKQPSQKAMLSKALQKANSAVQLDNAQNPESARQAYSEACELLQQVLQRTAGDEDRRKLEAIRETYTKRIEELDLLVPQHHNVYDEKALPRRPGSLDNQRPESMLASASDSEDVIVETATVTKIVRDDSDMRWFAGAAAPTPSYSAPTSAARRQYSTSATTRHLAIDTTAGRHNSVATATTSSAVAGSYSLQSAFSRSPMRADANNSNNSSVGGLGLQPRMYDSQYMPPPLSPRRPLSPVKPAEGETAHPSMPANYATHATAERLAPTAGGAGHRRENSHESVSWLDPIEESGGSSASSVHSRSSSVGIRRKHIRAPSGETEAEFDAALDDAIEAAYNDGYEPDDAVDPRETRGVTGLSQQQQEEDPDEAMATVLRRVELAREAVRASEREAMIWASEREKRLRLEQEQEDEMIRQQEEEEREADGMEDFFDGNDSDEEERFLEEMRREYALEDFTFTASQKQQAFSVPRASDSSGLTSRTWHSSSGFNPGGSNSTMLTTMSGSTTTRTAHSTASGVPPPPTQALPQLPPQPAQSQAQPRSSTPQQISSHPSHPQSVRSRRLSGQNARQLKIETSTILPSAPAPVSMAAPATAGPFSTQTKSGGYIAQQRQALSAGTHVAGRSFSARYATPSPVPGAGPGDASSTTAELALLPTGTLPRAGDGSAASPSVPLPGSLKKNFSSSSLRSLKSRNMSVSALHADDFSDHMSPGTPPSSQLGSGARLPAMPNLPTPLAGALRDRMNTTATGGLYLFDNDIHSPRGPTSPNPLVNDAPVPLEPCPTDAMLRPFWLMRCLYQTICHPRGGYISNKLFVPRDVWRVKGVKLKNIEDKIANCDYLTAALQKLAKVDNCDADAVLEEMQMLEGVLEQVQASLSRKLGNEVGVHGAGTLFKEASSTTAEGDSSSSSMSTGKQASAPKPAAPFHGDGCEARTAQPVSQAHMQGKAAVVEVACPPLRPW